jgi:hypothetical protein
MLSSRGRSREAAGWQTLAAKERLCDELDRSVQDGASSSPPPSGPTESDGAATTGAAHEPPVLASWAALPALPAAFEQKLAARRDAALSALADAAAAAKYRKRIEEGAAPRREWLLELEMMLKLESPPEMQALRLALQVRQLKERFSGAATGGAKTPADLVLQWCAQPGVANAGDRQRRDRVLAVIAKG